MVRLVRVWRIADQAKRLHRACVYLLHIDFVDSHFSPTSTSMVVFGGHFTINLSNLKSKSSAAKIHQDKLTFTIFRVEGADVYGSFLIGIALIDHQGNVIFKKMAMN